MGMARIISVDERLELTELKRIKTRYAPYLAAIQAAANEFVGPLGFLAYGVVQDRVNIRVVDRYVSQAKPEFDSKIAPLGVTVTFNALPVPGGLSVSWTASKDFSDSGSYTIAGLTKDFSDDWAEALSLAVNRWSRYVNLLSPEMADKILNSARVGYQEFMTEGSPTAKQLMAAIKHMVRLSAVDRTYYVNRVKEAVERYKAGYQAGKMAYAEVFKYVGDALAAATKLTISIFKVL